MAKKEVEAPKSVKGSLRKPIHRFEIHVLKTSMKRMDPNRLTTQLEHMRLKMVNPTRAIRGWKCKIITENFEKPTVKAGTCVYKATLALICKPTRIRQPEIIEAEYGKMLETLETYCKSNSWTTEVPGGPPKRATETRYAEASVPKEWKTHFSHLYEREDQTGIVLSAIQAGIKSDWTDRFHVLLVGPPACGKTEILRGVKNMLGTDAVLEYDATSTTQAGAIKDLAERQEIPRILLVEEMEKVDESSLRWMLSVLDHRGEIRKTNFRQQIHKQTKMLCIATVNDYKLFKSMMYGALASRFPNHVWCDRPGRKVLEMILKREIQRTNGSIKWIKPTLDYCDKRKISDPRKVISICLCGANDLLDGSYQAKLDRTDATKRHRRVD